jgi:UDP-N-acetylmuramyl-tripeptide synthetase
VTMTMSAPPISSPLLALERLSALGVLPSGVADDSRQVRPGDLFLAYPGRTADGRRYIGDAIARGAIAVLWESGADAEYHEYRTVDAKSDVDSSADFTWDPAWHVANLPVAGLRRLSGALAHAIYGRPSERLSLIAITGTNGKTTISHWIAQTYPRRCAIIGTLGAGFPDRLSDSGLNVLTTPTAPSLMRCLAEFVNADVEAQACALEASSIGIEEGRLDGARIDVAVFSNLTRDHLDYHGTMDRYAAAKEALFHWPCLRLAVINVDDPLGRVLAANTRATKILTYTQEESPSERPAMIRAEQIEETALGLRFRLCAPNGRVQIDTGLMGRYNVSNLLAVAAVLIDAGLTPKEIAACFAHLTPPPGRLEKVGRHSEPLVVIDYAHTPDALANALRALREVATARGAKLWVIFGCGGDRDRGKRPLMGEVAAALADHVVLSNDNPRSEDPQTILDAIRAGAPTADIIADRALAIQRTIMAAALADVVLIAGKGHEQYQEIAGVRRPFSDAAEARAALAVRYEAKKQ